MTTTGASETWQARISHDVAARLRRDAEVLGPFNGEEDGVLR